MLSREGVADRAAASQPAGNGLRRYASGRQSPGHVEPVVVAGEFGKAEESARRYSPIPPRLARLLRWHLRAFGCTADGRLFRGLAAARSAKALTAGSGTRPAPQPCRKTGQALRRPTAPTTFVMPRCRCGWPPAPARRDRCPRRAQRACPAHHLRPRHTRLRPIASQHIDRALRPSHWPPAGPQEPAQTPGILSVMRPCHSWTQRDTAGPETSAQVRLHVLDLRKYRPEGRLHGSRPRTGGPGHPLPISR